MREPPGAEKVRACLRRHGIRGTAINDLCQEVFVVAYLRKIEITDGWLCETARKLAANYRRLYRHEFEVLDTGAVEEAIVEPMEPELRESVRRALDELDPVDAELLVRHVLGGESLTKLARKLGLTKSGAHVRLARARRRFVERIR
jgi:RNA polymerase sigma factor (sigma-70 family)